MSGAWPMYRAMVGVGLLCGALIVTVFEVTRPRIAANRAAALEAAILEVLPGAASSRAFRATGDERFEPAAADADGPLVYGGYDESGELVGIAIEAAGMGYQDVISILWGYAPRQQAVVGMAVLDSRETPGLGDKIEKDPSFLANFERLDVSLGDDGAALRHAVVAVKRGEKDEPWEVDGITGATISSVAIAEIIDASAGRWLPTIRRELATLSEPPPAPAPEDPS